MKSVIAIAAVLAAAGAAQANFTYSSFNINGVTNANWSGINLGSGATPGTYIGFTMSFDWADNTPGVTSFSEGWTNEARVQLGTGQANANTNSAPSYAFGSSLQGSLVSSPSNGNSNALGQNGVLVSGAFNTAFTGGDLWFNYRQTFDGNNTIDWNTVSLTLVSAVQPTATHLGTFSSAANFNFNTFGTSLAPSNDTEIGVYDSNGNLLGSNDDSGGLLSSLNLANLADGTYFIAAGGFNVNFGAIGWNAVSGSANTGSLNVTIDNGVESVTANSTLSAGQVQWYSFTIPTPGALAAFGLAGLAAARRRR